ncbi:MAG: hypothetical protein AAGJ86_11685 [Pseudomonadota bacterium]
MKSTKSLLLLVLCVVCCAASADEQASVPNDSNASRLAVLSGDARLTTLRTKLESRQRLSVDETELLNRIVRNQIFADFSLSEAEMNVEIRRRFDASGEYERSQVGLVFLQKSIETLKRHLSELPQSVVTDHKTVQAIQGANQKLQEVDFGLLANTLQVVPDKRPKLLAKYTEGIRATSETEEDIFVVHKPLLVDQYLRENMCHSIDRLRVRTLADPEESSLDANTVCARSINNYIVQVLGRVLSSKDESTQRVAPSISLWTYPIWDVSRTPRAGADESS